MTPGRDRTTTTAALGGGSAAGLAVAWLWGAGGAGWLVVGLVIGAGTGAVALLLGRSEHRAETRWAIQFLAMQAGLGLIPFIALSGTTASRASIASGFPAERLLLVPLLAGIVAFVHEAARRAEPERRARPIRPAAPADVPHLMWLVFGLLLQAAVAAADVVLSAPYSLDYLYVVPVLLVTWHAGPAAGGLLAVVTAEGRGVVRGISYPGELDPAMVLLDSGIAAAGLGLAVALLWWVAASIRRESQAARTDPLTGLSNRTAFLERVDESVRRDRGPISIAYLDLDGFKAVNDTHGHAVGDEVLRIVAGALRTSLRADDVAARFGGDEFAILLPDTDPEVAPRVAERVRAEIEDRMNAFAWNVTCSVGMITSTEADRSTPDLLRHADALMYEVKRDGKNALRQMIVR